MLEGWLSQVNRPYKSNHGQPRGSRKKHRTEARWDVRRVILHAGDTWVVSTSHTHLNMPYCGNHLLGMAWGSKCAAHRTDREHTGAWFCAHAVQANEGLKRRNITILVPRRFFAKEPPLSKHQTYKMKGGCSGRTKQRQTPATVCERPSGSAMAERVWQNPPPATCPLVVRDATASSG